MSESLDSTSLVQRIVLVCLADLSESGETPANTAEIRQSVTRRLEAVDSHEVSRLPEADVMRALNALAETQLVEERRPEDRSPVGKGRPQYSPSVDPESLREAFGDDDRVAPLFDRG